MALLPRRVGEGAEELYRYAVRVTSKNYHKVLVGWAPRRLPLDSEQCFKVGFYANASGDVTSYHEPLYASGDVLKLPPTAKQGMLPQGEIIVCEYDRARGTIGFGWAGKAVELWYNRVPREPQLLPACHFHCEGDCVELVW